MNAAVTLITAPECISYIVFKLTFTKYHIPIIYK